MKNKKNNLYKYATLISCLLLLINISFSQTNQTIDKIVAVVGNSIVLKTDMDASKVQYISTGLPITDETECLLLEELLYQRLLLHQSEMDSIIVSEAEIQYEIDKRIKYFVDQIGSEKKLEDYYKKPIAQIKDDFHEPVKEQLASRTMQQQLTASVKVSPSEIREYYESIPKDSLTLINEMVQIAQIVRKPEINEESKKEVREQLQEYRKRVINGESFSVLATLYSQDEGSAVQGGKLGFMRRDMLVPEFASVAFKLQPNEVSEIVETEYGFHIIQLIEKRGEEANFSHILLRPQVSMEDLLKGKVMLDSVQNLLKKKELTFEEAAEKYSNDKTTKFNGGLVTNPQTGNSLFDVELLGQIDAALFFQIEKMEEGDITDPILFQDREGQAYRIVKLIKRKAPHITNLKDDYQTLQEMALVNKQKKEIDKWINKTTPSTYIKISDDYKDCQLKGNWIDK